jgi:hypothetical protein
MEMKFPHVYKALQKESFNYDRQNSFGCWHVIAWLPVTWILLHVQVICLD